MIQKSMYNVKSWRIIKYDRSTEKPSRKLKIVCKLAGNYNELKTTWRRGSTNFTNQINAFLPENNNSARRCVIPHGNLGRRGVILPIFLSTTNKTMMFKVVWCVRVGTRMGQERQGDLLIALFVLCELWKWGLQWWGKI